MPGRLFTAILLFVGLSGASVQAEESEPFRPTFPALTLSAGVCARNISYTYSDGRSTTVNGVSPWVMRLRADWYALPWLGLEGEALGDFFKAVPDSRLGGGSIPLMGGMGRLGVGLRIATESGFSLKGSLGYSFLVVPYLSYSDGTGADQFQAENIIAHGPAAHLGLSYSYSRFEASLSASAAIGVALRKGLYLEPQVWLGVRASEVGPAVLWVGLDAGLMKTIPFAIQRDFESTLWRFGIGLKLAPPAPPSKTSPSEGPLIKSATGEVGEPKESELAPRPKAPTGPGQLSGLVRSSGTARPIPNATVTAGEGVASMRTGADGSFRFPSVGPGPVKVRVEAQGFSAAEEMAQVLPEGVATLEVTLQSLGQGSPATVRGLVRSATGEPLKASVVIKGLPTKVKVTGEGRFVVTVPRGEYVFVITASGYVSQSKKVVLSEGDQAIFHTELEKSSR